MSLRFPSSSGGNGSTLSHDMIRFTPDDTNLVASMSPLRLGDQSTPSAGDYSVASEHTQLGSLCRHRARRIGDPSAWLDDPAGPYATYYCSCRREPRPKAAKTTADDDDGPGRDVVPPPDVAAAPVYGTSTAGVSRLCGHPRQHVVVCSTAATGGEKIYQDRYGSSCKYSTFLGSDEMQSKAARSAVSITLNGSSSHMLDHYAAATSGDDLTSSVDAVDLANSTPVNL